MSLKIDKNITLTGQSIVGGQQAIYLSASISAESAGNSNISQSITNQELYNANRLECRKDIADFQESVYQIEDSYIKEMKAAEK